MFKRGIRPLGRATGTGGLTKSPQKTFGRSDRQRLATEMARSGERIRKKGGIRQLQVGKTPRGKLKQEKGDEWRKKRKDTLRTSSGKERARADFLAAPSLKRREGGETGKRDEGWRLTGGGDFHCKGGDRG